MTDVSYDETCQVDCGSQNIMEHIKTGNISLKLRMFTFLYSNERYYVRVMGLELISVMILFEDSYC